MSLAGFEVDQLHVGFPRVSGDEPAPSRDPSPRRLFSPREWG